MMRPSVIGLADRAGQGGGRFWTADPILLVWFVDEDVDVDVDGDGDAGGGGGERRHS